LLKGEAATPHPLIHSLSEKLRSINQNGEKMTKGILLHEPDDDVGVAVMDLATGAEVEAVTLEGEPVTTVTLVSDVPLGHKVAMRDLPKDKHIIEYDEEIAYAYTAIKRGAHVHVHNIRSLRWSGKSQIIEHQED
jgi:(2R)-sulfolactate sulfo-lyase subunit alpha